MSVVCAVIDALPNLLTCLSSLRRFFFCVNRWYLMLLSKYSSGLMSSPEYFSSRADSSRM